MKTQKRTVIVGIASLAIAFGILFAACDNLASSTSTTPQKKLVSIAVTTSPDKTQYTLNETPLDTAGMVVTATYDDGSKEAVTGYTLSGFSSTTAGNKTITVSYGGQTTTFTINVIDPSKPTVVTPTATPPAGEVASGTTISLISSTTDAEIWYTADGVTAPAKNGTGSTKYTAPIAITTATIIKAIAVKDGMNDSGILEAAYTIIANNESFTNIADISAYLISQTGGTDTDNPLSLAVQIDLGNMIQAGSGWRELLDAISTAGKYVDIDLSGCSMTGTDFNPSDMFSFDNKNGRDLIVSIALPDVATSIGYDEFGGMGMGAFSDFDNLKTFSGENITIIGNRAFSGCTSLAITELPAGLITIGMEAFHSCIDLEQIELPNGVTSIGDWAFSGCTGLTSMNLPPIVSIGTGVFIGCASLTSFTVTGSGPLSVIENGEALVWNNTELVAYPSANGSITLPVGLVTIAEQVFTSNMSLTQITLPVGITSIKRAAFQGCRNLIQIELPEGFASIGDYAFDACISLTQIVLPGSVTAISDSAFEYCTNLALVICLAETPPTLGSWQPFSGYPNGFEIKVPAASVEAYKSAENWSTYADKISAIEE